MKKIKGFKLTKYADGTKVVSIREDGIFFAEDFAKLSKDTVILISHGEIIVPGANHPVRRKTGSARGDVQRKS